MFEVILNRFDRTDEITEFDKGKFETVTLGGMTIGRATEMNHGDLFLVPAEPHDSWVVGDEPYVSLHFLGAAKYAK
jgi:hypothetical protein